jgi:hypothetical protein
MRTLISVFLIGLSVALCQTTPQVPNAEHVVRRMLTRLPNGGFMYSSWDEKELKKLGDASAVEVAKLIEGKDVSADEIRQILLIVQASFEAPGQIKVESDRQPIAASLLVERLERLPASSGLTEDFVGTKKLLRRMSKVKSQ